MGQDGAPSRPKARNQMKPPTTAPSSSSNPSSSRPNRPTTFDPSTAGEKRSVSSASTATAVSVFESNSTVVLPTSPSKKSRRQGNNIKVVVRCRGPSKKEIRERSPIVVDCDGPRTEELTVLTDSNSSQSKRTYQFDQVFGADADQSLIYQEVVVPILNEVFDGYNATLCAYGQTGTGKTYTMHGDLNQQPTGALSPDAGIVPRVVTRLFQRLEKDCSDFTVSVSYMELYNEELRDLLTSSSSPTPLKVFEEPSKKGTLIQGLLELQVKDVKSAMNVLRIGNERRQMAATKLNEHSSRSHSIFTISVAASNSSSGGAGMFQIGKLNLVDLAGSEDIGRSGAENMRAKEAGLINRSLLTLGRVINALVDKIDGKNASAHIPYRESILTRVLQDSLGGHTKTCIIATISPVRSNLEETLSTLDYATRARSIKNNPEATRRISKDVLLKEMVSEMSRLRADLNATRERNGRYFDEERWAELELEQETLRGEHSESRKAREIVEARLATLKEEFEYNTLLLQRKEGELAEVRASLTDTARSLRLREDELAMVRHELGEEVVVRGMFEANEKELDRVAGGLKIVARRGISDLAGVFDKLDRKGHVLDSNASQVHLHAEEIAKSLQTLSSSLHKYRQDHLSLTESVHQRASSFFHSHSEALTGHLTSLEEQIALLSEGLASVLAKEDVSAQLSNALGRMISDTSASLRASFGAWKEGVVKNEGELLEKLKAGWMVQTGEATKSVQTIASVLDSLAKEVREFGEKERKNLGSLTGLTDSALATEIARLQKHNEELMRLARTEKIASDTMRTEVISQVSKILLKHGETRDAALKEATSRLSSQTNESARELESFKKAHSNAVGSMLAEGSGLVSRTDTRAKEAKRARDTGARALDALGAGLEGGIQRIREHLSDAVEEQQRALEGDTGTLDAAASGGFERLVKGQKARVESLVGIRDDVLQTGTSSREQVGNAGGELDATMGDIIRLVEAARSGTVALGQGADEELSALRATAKSLVRRAATDDVSTGSTPQKRKWSYEDEWEVVKDRANALKRYREQQEAKVVEEDARLEENDEELEASPPTMPVETPAYVDYVVPLAGSDGEADDARPVRNEPSKSPAPPTREPSPEPAPSIPVEPHVPVAAPVVPASRKPVLQAPRVPSRRLTTDSTTAPPPARPSAMARPARRVVSGTTAAAASGATRTASSSNALGERSNQTTTRKRGKM